MKLQSEFPLLEKYKEKFAITPDTIFAYDKEIYSNRELPLHLLIHELKHIEQQNRIGCDLWVDKYLNNPEFRLNEEVEAYQAELATITDRNLRYQHKIHCAKTLSSDLYGNIISYKEALFKL